MDFVQCRCLDTKWHNDMLEHLFHSTGFAFVFHLLANARTCRAVYKSILHLAFKYEDRLITKWTCKKGEKAQTYAVCKIGKRLEYKKYSRRT